MREQTSAQKINVKPVCEIGMSFFKQIESHPHIPRRPLSDEQAVRYEKRNGGPLCNIINMSKGWVQEAALAKLANADYIKVHQDSTSLP